MGALVDVSGYENQSILLMFFTPVITMEGMYQINPSQQIVGCSHWHKLQGDQLVTAKILQISTLR